MSHHLSSSDIDQLLREHRAALQALQALDDHNLLDAAPGELGKIALAKRAALSVLYPADGLAYLMTRDLSGRSLDYAIAVMQFSSHGEWDGTLEGVDCISDTGGKTYSPTTTPELADAIMNQYQIAVWPDKKAGGWLASMDESRAVVVNGKTMHDAALICAALSYHGDHTEIPRSVLEVQSCGRHTHPRARA